MAPYQNVFFFSLRGGAWVHKASLTPPLYIEVSVRSCLCVLRVSILPLSTIFLFEFVTVLTVLYVLLQSLLDTLIPKIDSLKILRFIFLIL